MLATSKWGVTPPSCTRTPHWLPFSLTTFSFLKKFGSNMPYFTPIVDTAAADREAWGLVTPSLIRWPSPANLDLRECQKGPKGTSIGTAKKGKGGRGTRPERRQGAEGPMAAHLHVGQRREAPKVQVEGRGHGQSSRGVPPRHWHLLYTALAAASSLFSATSLSATAPGESRIPPIGPAKIHVVTSLRLT